MLHSTVLTFKPCNCFEIGTWRGGGSTFYISHGLYENGAGILHTIEINKEYFNEAQAKYKWYASHLLPYINFHFSDYEENFFKILNRLDKIDLLMLDGAEDAQQTLNQYNVFAPYLKKDSILLLHDWLTEKVSLVKPIIENEKDWNIRSILLPPKSIGFALATKN